MRLINGKKPSPIIKEIEPKHCCATCGNHRYLDTGECYYIGGYQWDSGDANKSYEHVCQLWTNINNRR